MAAIQTTRPSTLLATGHITGVLSNLFNTISSWNDARITRKSLSKLSARELDDIGLTAADIDAVATRIYR